MNMGWAELGHQANTPFSAFLEHAGYQNSWGEIKGTVSRDFKFFLFHLPQTPDNSIRAISIFILFSHCNTRCTAGFVDTDGKFTTDVNNTSSNSSPVSTTLVADNDKHYHIAYTP
jgi:hypothetical protein